MSRIPQTDPLLAEHVGQPAASLLQVLLPDFVQFPGVCLVSSDLFSKLLSELQCGIFEGSHVHRT